MGTIYFNWKIIAVLVSNHFYVKEAAYNNYWKLLSDFQRKMDNVNKSEGGELDDDSDDIDNDHEP